LDWTNPVQSSPISYDPGNDRNDHFPIWTGLDWIGLIQKLKKEDNYPFLLLKWFVKTVEKHFVMENYVNYR
jgi:hypothetical protein